MSIRKIANSVIRKVKQAMGQADPENVQSEATDALNDQLDAMIAVGHDGAVPWAPMNKSGVNMMYGNQVADAEGMPDGWIPVQDNQLWPLLTQEQAVMSQRRPQLVASPFKPDDEIIVKLVKDAEGALNWLFVKGLKVEMMLLRAMIDGQTHGQWITACWWDEKAKWNEEKRDYEGRIRVDLLSPNCFYADPVAETAEDWRFAYTYRLIPVGQALQRWPKFRKQIIKAALHESEQREDDPSNDGISGRLLPDQETAATYEAEDTSRPLNMHDRARLVRALNYAQNATHGVKTKDDKKLPGYVTVLEMIFEDEEVETANESQELDEEALVAEGRLDFDADGRRMDPETGEEYTNKTWPVEETQWDQPKYPNGRHVIRFGLDAVVHDEPWQYEHWLWTIGIRGLLPHTWHGQNAVEPAKDSQDLLNQLRAYVVNYAKNHAHVEIRIEENTLVEDPELENVGAVMAKGPDNVTKIQEGKMEGIQNVAPPSMSAGLSTLIEKIEQSLRDTVGIQTVDMGRGDANTLGQDVLNETKSRLRTALQSMFMDDYIVRLMEQAWEIAQDKWQEQDTIRIIGEGGSVEGVPLDPLMLDAEFDIKLEVGTAMPFDRERIKVDAMTLYNLLLPLGYATLVVKWVLEAFEVPNADEIADEMIKGGIDAPETSATSAAGGKEKKKPAATTDAGKTGEQAQKRVEGGA